MLTQSKLKQGDAFFPPKSRAIFKNEVMFSVVRELRQTLCTADVN